VTFEFVGIAYAILIGFVIVSLWDTQQDATQIVSTEASALEDMSDLTLPLDPSVRAEVGGAVTHYIDVVANDEFKAMRKGHDSAEAEQASRDLFRTIAGLDVNGDLETDLRSRLLDAYNDVDDARNSRIALANRKLAGELWMLILVSSGAMVFLIAAFEGDGRWDTTATVIISATIGLVLFAMMTLSYPFSGDVSVDPGPLRATAEAFKTS
jgi:hypothetical protein